MDSEELIFQQYKLYTDQKEKFVDRSFQTNKFYLVVVLVLVLAIFLTKDHSFAYGLAPILSVAGIAVCVFWWINVDSYNLLLKVKLSKVIEEIEKKLPVQPYTQEFMAIKDLRKNKRIFLFSDVQKTLALFALSVFLVIFIREFVPLVF